MAKEKKVIPVIELEAKDFHEKILMSLEKADGVTVPMRRFDYGENMNNYLFLLLNTRPSERMHCQVCGGSHWFRVVDVKPKEERDRTAICDRCGEWLVNFSMLEVNPERIKEWMVCEGEINPQEILHDRVEEMIKEGKIKVSQGKTNGTDDDNTTE